VSKVIYIASGNAHKIEEISAMLIEKDFEVKGLKGLSDYEPPEETGQTFIANARIKALALRDYLLKKGMSDFYVLADDSGLECHDIEMKPGVHSARFAGQNATDEENNQKLVDVLQTVTHLTRDARYVCALLWIKPDGSEEEVVGTCEGNIVFEPKGENGFGYDPYFYLLELNQTMAEITPEHKNKISHRAKALRALLSVV
jgi:XTP/dITP diphosphohydrolase